MSQEFDKWVGREERIHEEINVQRAQALARTLDLEDTLSPGAALPPGWQWLYFNPFVIRRSLGEDGHPQRGGFLPPIELPRRMWAGSRIQYVEDIALGAIATRVSRIQKIQNKVGKRGSLWFVTVEHTTLQGDRVCVIEEQDIVYREATPLDAPKPPPAPAHPETYEWVETFSPDPVLLYRYSALTFNGHRIHYDQPYATGVEGYEDLVVHGPLTATLLQCFARKVAPGKNLKRFDFKGVTPLFVNRDFTLEARQTQETGVLELCARGPGSELAMSAVATFV